MAKEFWSNDQRRLGHPLSNGQRYGKWSNFENSRNFRINNRILQVKAINLISNRFSKLLINIYEIYILVSNKTTREIPAGLTAIKNNEKLKKQ